MNSKKARILVSGIALTLLFGQGVAKIEAKGHKNPTKFEDRNRNSLSDKWEKKYKLKGRNLAKLDHDKDGLNNLVEYKLNLNPKAADSNKNGVLDAQEDTDKDGLSNLSEVELGTNPADSDTNNNKILDGSEKFKHGIKFGKKIREFEIEIETADEKYKAKYNFKKGKTEIKIKEQSISKEFLLLLVNKLERSSKLSEQDIVALIETELALGETYNLEVEVEYMNGKEIEIEIEKQDENDDKYSDDDNDDNDQDQNIDDDHDDEEDEN